MKLKLFLCRGDKNICYFRAVVFNNNWFCVYECFYYDSYTVSKMSSNKNTQCFKFNFYYCVFIVVQYVWFFFLLKLTSIRIRVVYSTCFYWIFLNLFLRSLGTTTQVDVD